MDREQMREGLHPILFPEFGEGEPQAFPPHDRLKRVHQLDASHWSYQEFSSASRRNRSIGVENTRVRNAVESLTVPESLCWAALRLFGEALTEYAEGSERTRSNTDHFRFFPSVLMTFWAGFEACVRLQSELLTEMVPAVPGVVKLALLEREEYVDDRGIIRERNARRPLLDRYYWLLKYGYCCDFDRGSRIWQAGKTANAARNALVHYEVADSPSLTCRALCEHLEAITLLWIGPSVQLGRSIFYAQFDLYYAIAEMHALLVDFEERPIHKGWLRRGPVLIPCTFDGVDDARYPRGGDLDPDEWSLRVWDEHQQKARAELPEEVRRNLPE